MRQRSSSNQFARDCIYTALMLLMEEKEFEHITITEIAERAGVSRVTYYRNYDSREDILLKKFEEVFDKHTHDVLHEKEMSEYDMILDMVLFFEENKKLILNIVQAGKPELMVQQFRREAEQLAAVHTRTNDMKSRYGFHFVAGGFMFLIMQWIESGMKESAEEISVLFHEYVDPFTYIKFR